MAADERDRHRGSDKVPMTELDVRLPGKIAVSHAEQTLTERETLPRVPLPTAARLQNPPAPDPPFVPEAFPALDEDGRPTELVPTARPAPGQRSLPAFVLVLIGAAIGAAVALGAVLLVR